MNRKTRRLKQREYNRLIRKRERELKRNIKEINIKADNGYLSEDDAVKFLVDLYKKNEKQKGKYE